MIHIILSITFSLFASDLKKLEFSNGTVLKVEVADSETKRSKGLMHRTSLPKDQGMLFVFKRPQKLSFWMRNTFIPLSIGYFDKHNELKEIYHMKAQNMMERDQNLKSYPSLCLCQYALEVNQGWFAKNQIKVGSKFKLHK